MKNSNCACKACQTGRGACLKALSAHWVVRRSNGNESGPFSTHAEALAYARRIAGGGTPVKREG